MAEIVARLTQQDAPVAISTQGMGGVGKTTLATMIAYHEAIRAHFSDGILWAGLGPQGEAMSQLAQWGDALGLDVRPTSDYTTRHAAIKNRLGQGKYLLIIDDVWDEQTAQWLKCGGPNCRHVLTMRKQEIALTFDLNPTPLAELSPESAWELLQTLAPEACAAKPDLAQTLVQAVGYLPLAIELLGGYLKATRQRVFPNQRLKGLTELQDPTRRLQLIQTALSDRQGLTLAQIIHLSLADLPATAVAAFYALGVFASKPATFSLTAALALTQSSEDDLAFLVDSYLLTKVEKDNDVQLNLHQVMADLAKTELAQNPLSAKLHLRHYTYYLLEADKYYGDWRHMETIYGQLKYAWEHASNDDRLVLIGITGNYQKMQGLWADKRAWLEEALHYYEQALPIYQEVGSNKVVYAAMLRDIGGMYQQIGQPHEALRYHEKALFIDQEVGDKVGYAMSLNNMGEVYRSIGQPHEALRYHEQALPIHQEVGNKEGYATTLQNMGLVYYGIGQPQDALRHYEQALLIHQEVGDKERYAATLQGIGLVYNAIGQPQEALRYYEQALPIHQEVGNKAMYANTLNNMGGVYRVIGQSQKALRYYNEALFIVQEVGAKASYAVTLQNIGTVYLTIGQPQDALRYYEQALPIHQEVGNKASHAITLQNIAVAYNAIGQPQEALRYYEQALSICLEVGDRNGESVTRFNMAYIYAAQGDWGEVVVQLRQCVAIAEVIQSPHAARWKRELVMMELLLKGQQGFYKIKGWFGLK